METQTAIRQRRAVKHYDPEHQLTDGEIDQLFDLAVQSPTSFNLQNWRLLAVTDADLRKEIRAAAWDQAQVSEASLLVILCADLNAWNKSPERYWVNAPKAAQEILVPMIQPFYEGKPQLQRDEAMRSVGMAGQTIMLAAKDMGYDSCPMIGFDPEQVAKLINLPEDYVIGFMIAVGKPTKPAWEKPGVLPRNEVVFKDRFPG
ncbi:MAG: nitroreductase family protein [Verrucomicrobiota bacterium]